MSVVKAVAAGVPSLAPFFDESIGLGQDARVRSRPAHGSLQQGDTPGLYGGTKKPTICDVERLEQFLTDPANGKKAQAWAGALDITTERIPDYLDRLTPVLLRHDTLVKNHDYKKEKAVPFNSLLQAGIAILVDAQGLPAVKCSCGNPVRPFEGDTGRISVEFEDGNKKWQGYERSSVVAVRPAPRTLERIALVDVVEPDRGIDRPVGTTGEDDSTFDTRKRRAVPHLAGTTFGQASRQLADRGLAAAYDGKGLPPDGARVTASDPPPGTELRFGEYVTLSVAGGASGDTPGGSPGGSTGRSPGGSPGGSATSPAPSPSGPGTTPPPSSSSGGPGPSPSEPPSSNPPPSSERPPSSPPAGSGSEPPPSSSPPSPDPPTSSPPTGDPVTSAAPPPPTSAPVTSEPASTGPASSEPAMSAPESDAPATHGPATGEPTASAAT
ncbi:PASTA domain-containing protein [Streptomyces sp. NL15-2K]|uniref:PASTA domain-containing protein n=1 Tax=Streptomyces sp. NL15-2K TaxID=376149 RepID=UPI000FFA0993|nr:MULTISPECIES: PASTA domain-containing protein [Actinomycetes]WKX07195.1 PASTA domain-containing protein [Kutzneria buriramensis]GCB51607.1 hypothetical protein SNL152K_8963 [Streptomyces sp. NL15-2K]